MTIAEIIILIIGAILFTVSFFIPDRDSDGGEPVSEESARKAVKNAVSEEIKKIKITIDEATEESINDNKDKMERYMDRLTNEKMMAVNEYSDTVIEQIHKDHEEAVFLYDMIDSKYKQVKATAAEINQIEKSVRKLSEEIPKIPEMPAPISDSMAVKEPKAEPLTAPVQTTPVKKEETKVTSFEPIKAPEVVIKTDIPPVKTEDKDNMDKEFLSDEPVAVKEEPVKAPVKEAKPVKKSQPKPKKTVEAIDITPASGVELMFDSDSNSMNNNDKILALHKAGKSNMAIAKELGLGVGEVKLVIDLFKNY